MVVGAVRLLAGRPNFRDHDRSGAIERLSPLRANRKSPGSRPGFITSNGSAAPTRRPAAARLGAKLRLTPGASVQASLAFTSSATFCGTSS